MDHATEEIGMRRRMPEQGQRRVASLLLPQLPRSVQLCGRRRAVAYSAVVVVVVVKLHRHHRLQLSSCVVSACVRVCACVCAAVVGRPRSVIFFQEEGNDCACRSFLSVYMYYTPSYGSFLSEDRTGKKLPTTPPNKAQSIYCTG
jgi:hypothetical protein